MQQITTPPGPSTRAPMIRASAVCSRMAKSPAAQAHKSTLRKRHTPFVQAKRNTHSRSRQHVRTTAVFDYCSTARGNSFTSSFRGTKALLMQLVRSNVSPESRPEVFKALVCLAYLAEINTWVVLSVALPGMTSDPTVMLPAASVGMLLAIGTAGLTIGKAAAGVVLDKINPKWALVGVLIGAAGFNSLMAAGNTLTWFNITWFLSRAVYASGWVAASRLICCWTPEETRGASLGSLAFAARVGFTVGSSALGGLLLIGVSWRLLFHITTIFAFIMAAVLAVGMPDEYPYDLGGGGADDYNLGTRPTQVSLDPGAGKVLTAEIGPDRGESAEGSEASEAAASVAQGQATQAKTMGAALKDFLTTPQVLMAIVARCCLHTMYEFTAFMNMWAVESLGVSGGVAAQISAAFSGGSAVAVLVGGMLFCRYTGAGRRNFITALAALAASCFFILTKVTHPAAVVTAVILLGAGWAVPYYVPLPAYNLRKGGSFSAVLEGLCETCAYGSAMVFDIFMGQWLKGPNGYGKMMSTLLICSVGAVVFIAVFMQQEKVYEDNLIRM
ncbi:hypothetical protein ABBQ32_000201 [Trebouxia sp. C0010 RCD-2024]